ncbi:MAG: zinc ribbon domain-containing protein [Lentisphaerae bacterium]|nr:MAG: zinc ribbon domain-containing protein [Lentisphaerota bacterium]
MKPCRECEQDVSEHAPLCPHCGAPWPGRAQWDGWGFEYKSSITFWGWPLIHISFKYRPNRVPVPARGIIAIGQFACGILTIAQFSIGLFSLGQFTIAGYALAQFALAYCLIAQIGVYLYAGYGQLVWHISELFPFLSWMIGAS